MEERRKYNTYSAKCATVVFMLGMMIGSFIHFERSTFIMILEIIAAGLMFHLTHCTSYFSFFGKKQ